MNEDIIKFARRQTCATISCINGNNKPYCFNCFYAFNSELGLLYFKSSADTRHSKLIKQNPFVAGTILPDKLKTLLVQGIQFEGELLAGDHPLAAHASANYHKEHPMALAMQGEIWTIQINHIKMTDSSKGFGKKIAWDREGKFEVVEI
ncbi:pyridoxamine 5'-phosphate oxidase family protein [Mucilaginibacter gotjawali]|uniref:Uncharacterized protein n=2 Tax=Mucilaginibacter gotjawali TaxID=1550579 RepID=A0A839SB75_9SPHI|nr:pyridoxamine 5'-phosphate oxidase family protein [Mucilaginibacter gotjawali]MBB3055355.1 hypothetical protein [Mucilaginibacter gotjawali]BAU53368.1 hypothetical protein MgSA37_01535 [Mucilaginibacter gotjawali]